MQSTMRRFVGLMCLVIVMATGFIYLTASQAGAESTVTVRGNLRNLVGTTAIPIANQKVLVTCGGVTNTVFTDSNGLYVTTFTTVGCAPGQPTTSQTFYNGKSRLDKVWVSGENRATNDMIFG